MSTFAERLRSERRRLNMNQTEFGRLGGVSKATQVAYEGGTTTPQIGYLEGLHMAGLDTHYLVTGIPRLALREDHEWELIFKVIDELRHLCEFANLQPMTRMQEIAVAKLIHSKMLETSHRSETGRRVTPRQGSQAERDRGSHPGDPR